MADKWGGWYACQSVSARTRNTTIRLSVGWAVHKIAKYTLKQAIAQIRYSAGAQLLVYSAARLKVGGS